MTPEAGISLLGRPQRTGGRGDDRLLHGVGRASETQRDVSLAIEGLERDYHTVEIEVLEARDPKATASRVVLDAFDVLP